MVSGHVEEEFLPEDVPSVVYKGFSYRADRKIGEGGQAFGVFMARMIRIKDEDP